VRRPPPRLGVGVAAALLAAYALLGVAGLRSDSSVADEHPHILSGFLYWTSGRFAGGLDNPPLGQLLVAAPLAALRLPYRFPSDEHLALCRLPVLLLGLGLAALLWRWGAALAGEWGGVGALAALCCEPNLLAHAHLATLDLPSTAIWWGTLWAWRRYLLVEAGDAPGRGARARAAALFALAFAAGGLTKFTGLLLLPAAWLVAVLALRGGSRRARATLALAASVAGLAVLSHLVYAFEPVRAGLPEHLVAALRGKMAHRSEVRFAYLAGRTSDSGFLQYYVVALLLKTPLGLLGLAALGACALGREARQARCDRGPGAQDARPVAEGAVPVSSGGGRVDLALLVVPAALLVAATSAVRVDIGLRHVLPVYPALVLLAAIGARALCRRGWGGRALLAVLGLASGAGMLRTAPQYLAYFNVLAGGQRGGDRWLLDSNLDWGQDDARLGRFLDAASTRGETWDVNPPPRRARTGRLAVNANSLHNLLRRSGEPYAWLRPLAPVGFAGASWRLYDLHVEDFERAAAAHPERAETQVALAEVLSASGAARGAEQRYEVAMRRFPTSSLPARSAARGALERHDVPTARGWVERGLREHPEDGELGLLRERIGLEEILAAAAGRGAQPAAHAALELGLWRAEHGEAAEALGELELAAHDLPRDVEAQRAYAVALAHRGEFPAALAVLGRREVSSELAAERAACERLARGEEALRAAERGGPPVEAGLLRELGQIHFQDGRYDRAAAALVQALRQRPDDGEALALLCEMHVRSKLRLVAGRLQPRRIGGRRGA